MLGPQGQLVLLNLKYRIKDVCWCPVWPPPVSWDDFMMLNYIPIHLFSPERSFVPLKIDLREKEKQLNFFRAVFKTKETRAAGVSERMLFAAQTGS